MSDPEPRNPHIVVHLRGRSWRPREVINRVVRALRRAGVPEPGIEMFIDRAEKARDLDALLKVVLLWVRVR